MFEGSKGGYGVMKRAEKVIKTLEFLELIVTVLLSLTLLYHAFTVTNTELRLLYFMFSCLVLELAHLKRR